LCIVCQVSDMKFFKDALGLELVKLRHEYVDALATYLCATFIPEEQRQPVCQTLLVRVLC
jgi:hypothetical protein